VEDPDLLFDTWKPAEDGNGTILRLIDLGGQPRTVRIDVPLFSIAQLFRTDAGERDQEPIIPDGPHSFTIDVRPHRIVTLRLVAQ
jgi:alpha-mannosidase